MNEFSLLDRTPSDEENSAATRQNINPIESVPSPVVSSTPHSQAPVRSTSQAAGLIQIPERTFEHDLAIGDRRQKFSGELLRLALLGILAVGFLLINFLFSASDKAPELFGIVKKTLGNSDFRFYVFASLYLFGFSAGLALLHRYFAFDGAAFHLKYLRLREKQRAAKQTNQPESVSHLIPHSRRGFFDGFWLYLFGAETDELQQQIENEKDARNFLFKISGWLLFLSGSLLWLGAISLILAFGVVFRQFGA